MMTHAIDDPLDLAAGTHGVSIEADFADVPQDYYLVAQLDAGSSVDETDESNNTQVFEGGVFRDTDGTIHAHAGQAADRFSFLDRGGNRLEILHGPSPQQYDCFWSYSAVHVRGHQGDDEISMLSTVCL